MILNALGSVEPSVFFFTRECSNEFWGDGEQATSDVG